MMDGAFDVDTARGIAGATYASPRVALLRSVLSLPVIETLKQPRWHVFCDQAMGAVLTEAGLPADRMTIALERGEFLEDRFVCPVDPETTILVATRRSEEAVVGVLRSRGLRAMPLFGVFLMRLAALAPARMNVASLQAMPQPQRAVALIGPDGGGVDRAEAAMAARPGICVARPFGAPQVAMARAQADVGFEVAAWWSLLTRARPGQGTLVLRFSLADLQDFVTPLAQADAAFVGRALAGVPAAACTTDEGRAFKAFLADLGQHDSAGAMDLCEDGEGNLDESLDTLLGRAVRPVAAGLDVRASQAAGALARGVRH